MPWEKRRKRKFNPRFIVYKRNEYLTREILSRFQCPSLSPHLITVLNFVPHLHFTFHLNPSKFLSFIFSHPLYLVINETFHHDESPFSKHNLIPLTQSRHLSNQTPSIVHIYIYVCTVHENQSTIFNQIPFVPTKGFTVNLFSINQSDIQEFSIRKLIHPSIFVNDRWFQQLYQPSRSKTKESSSLSLKGKWNDFFRVQSRRHRFRVNNADSTLVVDIPLHSSKGRGSPRESSRSSRDIVAIIIRHVHFVALRFLFPRTPRNSNYDHWPRSHGFEDCVAKG